MKIAVFGASGYTGRLAVAEAQRRGLDVVLVGRGAERLRAAASEAGFQDVEIRVADAEDHDALVAAFRDADAVVNCAGPFARWGEGVVRAAIAAGSHYVDTTGEQLYIRHIFDTFGAEAERAGVAVIPGVTDDGLPSDLIAALTAARVDGEAEEIAIAVDITSGGASRGTIRSMGAMRDTLLDGGLGYEGGELSPRATARNKEIVLPGGSAPTPVVRFALPAVVTVPRHVRTRHVEGLTSQKVYEVFTGLSPELAEKVPEGPTAAERKAMRWAFAVEVLGADGRRARGEVRGSDAYGTTAVIAVEAARRLATDGAPSGVLAPAQAFDAAGFLDFLGDHGVSWSVGEAAEA
ncbi:saccharopine dehydrogenase family protein [Streptomyces sp. ME19-01-6]|uniref:saccharopine dehydrogenase family protein n=1 Tax=Streptomyces sp. ME19-01-6 TaxID=3028686 RepID=UPI0029A636AB|nr:saccharopine dehydrogenase NADP-binding domain-containing protein [Streptomyces sp. ME19-01-6]MDX3228118.1 saccharopine dehydrogenase NADP-binding domain-containing protein [Streptomyces sp. ME19-01-6]